MTALITVLHGITVWKGFEYVTGSCWAAIVSYQGHDLLSLGNPTSNIDVGDKWMLVTEFRY